MAYAAPGSSSFLGDGSRGDQGLGQSRGSRIRHYRLPFLGFPFPFDKPSSLENGGSAVAGCWVRAVSVSCEGKSLRKKTTEQSSQLGVPNVLYSVLLPFTLQFLRR